MALLMLKLSSKGDEKEHLACKDRGLMLSYSLC